MTFIVEDGTGKDDANALVDLAFVNSYFSDRGEAGWTGTDTVKQQSIVVATDYVETRWASLFKGQLEFIIQALSFPRINLFDRDNRAVLGMPDKLKKAVSEYALRALTTDLYTEPTTDVSGQTVQAERVKVGPIETDKEFVSGGAVSTIKDIPEADNLLQEYVRSFGGDSVIRA